jgi:hypothetical protein
MLAGRFGDLKTAVLFGAPLLEDVSMRTKKTGTQPRRVQRGLGIIARPPVRRDCRERSGCSPIDDLVCCRLARDRLLSQPYSRVLGYGRSLLVLDFRV